MQALQQALMLFARKLTLSLLHEKLELDVGLLDCFEVCRLILQGSGRVNIAIEDKLVRQLQQLN